MNISRIKTFSPPEPAEQIPRLEGEDLAAADKYLRDESRHTGTADCIFLPRSTEETACAVAAVQDRNQPVTVSGARTGITGGAVPPGGALISLERMDRILGVRELPDGHVAVHCESGVTLDALSSALEHVHFPDAATPEYPLEHLKHRIREEHLFFPPDPTETTATIGGAVACNASGAHTFKYGPTRNYVQWLKVVLADGSMTELERDQVKPDAEENLTLERTDGDTETFHIPTYSQPETKNVAGYYTSPNMDALDLFVGSEGTLGIICEAEVILKPRPEVTSSTVVFLESETAAVKVTHDLRKNREAMGIEAIEYFDPYALSFMNEHRQLMGPASGVPPGLPHNGHAAIYLDIGCPRSDIPQVLNRLAELSRQRGADPARCWSAESDEERERLRLFRHALPEAVNGRIAAIQRNYPGVRKLGTDMAVPDQHLDEILRYYRQTLDEQGLSYVIFGHIGNNHLHVNILPEDEQQYNTGKQLYEAFARKAVELGGSPAAEHGIGKLKKESLEKMVGEAGLREMKNIKKVFDPEFRLGRETLFSCE